jgi:hypothetical protein
MTTTSELAVVNEALVRLGVPPVGALSELNAQGVSASTLLETTRQELIADHPWSFALREAALSELSLSNSDERLIGYDHVYQLPPGILRIIGLRSRSPYRISADQLYTNAKDAELVYLEDVGVSYWPPHFRRALVFSLAAAMALPITDSTSRADLYYSQARQGLQRARAIDSQQVPSEVFNLMRVYTRGSHNPLAGA